jgi:sortase A
MMKKIAGMLLSAMLLLVGLGVLLYPKISDRINRLHSSSAVQSLGQQMQNTSRAELDRQLALARGYNASLLDRQPFPTEYGIILNFGDGIMGFLRIPCIDVELPVYHGVDSSVLAKGVGHMPQSAFPIGGEGNHSVLTGHTGLPSAELFTDLIKMRLGDLFYITVAGEELVYRVDQILTVTPVDNAALAPESGKDYCTLVTCTPYGINSHRLLVRGTRVEEGDT